MSSPDFPPKIIITGATSIIGVFLLPRLLAAGYEVHAVSRDGGRKPPSAGENLVWHWADITHPEQLPRVDAAALIHLAPLWLLPPLLPVLDSLKIKRIIGFGSTSRFSKANSADIAERNVAARLTEAEEKITAFCGASKIDWTIFRPTLVYDCARDQNISRIANFIRRYRFFPLVGKGVGQRQPVHADDLAQACILALSQPATFNKAYNLSGGETLSYRAMVERIFDALGVQMHFIVFPVWLYRGGIRAAMLLPGKRGITPEMATRMNSDLCFDHSEAARDFGFSPRPFLPYWNQPQ
jgi:nucleoside-diphosphate-sugar epimerase